MIVVSVSMFIIVVTSCNGNELASFYDQNHDRFEFL